MVGRAATEKAPWTCRCQIKMKNVSQKKQAMQAEMPATTGDFFSHLHCNFQLSIKILS